MTSQKHGKYDQEKKLPDNRMQPNESGLNVWLQGEIISRLGKEAGEELICEAVPLKTKRYKWMLERMAERGHQDLVEEYHKHKLALEVQRRIRDKERELRLWKQQLAWEGNPQRLVYIGKQIVKCEKYLEKRSPK